MTISPTSLVFDGLDSLRGTSQVVVDCLSVWVCRVFVSRSDWGFGFGEVKCHSHPIISRVPAGNMT